MKKFETPEIEVVSFSVEDIITTSTPGSGNGTILPDDGFEL